MELQEVAMLVKGISARYPNWAVKDVDATIKAWYVDLKDYDAMTIGQAFVLYRNDNPKGFAPSVDTLIDLTHKVHDLEQLTPLEAWNLVSLAIRRSSVHAQEEFNKLPALVQLTVGRASQLYAWSQTDLGLLETSIARQFQNNYEIQLKRAREIDRMPAYMQEEFKALTEKTLAALPQWENPTPVVVAKEMERAEIQGSYLDKLKALWENEDGN